MAYAILLTGVTGTVGSWLAVEALRHGVAVRALVRDKDGARARRRVDSALQTAGAIASAEGVEIVSGDLCRPGLGLADARQMLAGVSAIWHSAAYTGFDEGSRQINYDTNVLGTMNVLALAEELHLPLVYISTAYVSGKRQGLIREDELNLGQAFHNPYEWTKCQAETLVHQWAQRTGLKAIILRPSIILGDSITGRIVHFNTVYHLMRLFDSSVVTRGDGVRVLGRADATKNMLPVDYFARAAWHIVERGEPGTYHLTNPSPMPMEELRRTFCQLFDTQGIRLVEQEDFDRQTPTRSERLVLTASRPYSPYMLGEAQFDRLHAQRALAGSGIDLPPMDLAYFQRLLAYARQRDWCASPDLSAAAKTPSCFEQYFGNFLVTKMNQRLLQDLRNLTARFRIIPTETPEVHWSLDVCQGVLTSISRNGVSPDCSFMLDGPAFTDIVAGRLAPQQAFFRRRVDIGGDIETGLRVASMLGTFFRTFPFEVGG